MRHNILLERVPEIVAVMRQSEQCFFELSSKEGAYCALGCIAEAYRRAYPHSCNWVTTDVINFEIQGNRYRSKLPIEVIEWAIGDNSAITIFIDGKYMSELNDAQKYTLNEFADILEGKI